MIRGWWWQRAVQGSIEQRRQGLFAPKGQRQLIVQMEDVNLPRSDHFGARPVLELLRQGLRTTPALCLSR